MAQTGGIWIHFYVCMKACVSDRPYVFAALAEVWQVTSWIDVDGHGVLLVKMTNFDVVAERSGLKSPPTPPTVINSPVNIHLS